MNIKCSINTSVKELIHDDYTLWAQDLISSKSADRSDVELEITESHSLQRQKINR